MKTIRHYENLHIPLWLIKDTCWMMEFKVLGVCMISPTLIVALILLFKTKKETEFWVNLAICFWIIANSYWMITEFVNHLELKNYALIPFIAGMICVVIFYLKGRKITA
jgi:hypothetical protein